MLAPNNLEQLQRKIAYQFNNITYLKQALTHCSASNDNNERLEFLGDSILNFIIASALVSQFSCQNEGELSRLRAFLVKGEMLAEIALELQLGDYLYLGQGELKSGGFRRASILADALEALIAAIFLDSGIQAAEQFILSVYKTRLSNKSLDTNHKDAKTRLQEFLQAKKMALPEYRLSLTSEHEGELFFHIECIIAGIARITQGKATNRRKAEQQAAQSMLLLLNI